MAAKALVVERPARKQLKILPLHIHIKIVKTLDKIQKDPVSGVKLHGELANYYKFRVGDYRIIYSFNSQKSIVYVVKIEHRQGVYR